jgi:O-antigen/teichoic acid export membrane protein
LQLFKIASSFLLISLLLQILGEEHYGVWVTLTSMIGWFSVFDLGLDNGLRNEVARREALGQSEELKDIIGASYLVMGSVSFIILLIGFLITYQLNFNSLLKVDSISNEELRTIMSLLFFSFASRLTLKIVGGVVHGLQKSGLNKIQDTSSTLIFLIILFVLRNQAELTILQITIVNVFNAILIWIVFSLVIYKVFKHVRPRFGLINRELIRPVFGSGIIFFISQIAAVIVLTTDQFIMNNIFGPEFAGSFAVVDRVFQIPQIFFAILNATLWSSFTDAYFRRDKQWILKTLKYLRYLWGLLLIPVIILMFLFDFILSILGASQLEVSVSMIVAVGFIRWSMIFINIYGQFINGVGLVKKQLWFSIPAAILNIPLSYFLAGTSLGPTGVVLATLIVQAPFFIWSPWITYKTINSLK